MRACVRVRARLCVCVHARVKSDLQLGSSLLQQGPATHMKHFGVYHAVNNIDLEVFTITAVKMEHF